MTSPAQLDQPFHFWMLDRLVVYLTQIKGIPIKRSRLSEIFRQEGLRWRHQEDWFGERVDPDFAEKRGHRNPLHCPPPANSVVVCIDEMGPLSTRSHPGQELVATQPTESKPAGRAKQEVDCGRTQREGYVFGAFQPASGEVVIATSTSRSIKHFVDFLDQVEAAIPLSIEQVYVVLDNLGAHQAYDVLLFNLAHLRSSLSSSPNMPPTST